MATSADITPEALEALSKKAQEPGALLADKGAFLIALETAYRTGQLIPAPSVDNAMVERACRAWREAEGMNPDCLYEHHEWDDYPEDAREEYEDPFTGQKRVRLMHKSWRKLAKRMTAAISAMQVKP